MKVKKMGNSLNNLKSITNWVTHVGFVIDASSSMSSLANRCCNEEY